MLDKNLIAIKEYYPEIYSKFISSQYQYEENIRVSLVETNGYLNCKVETDNIETYLHSSYDCFNEASKWSGNLSEDTNMYIIVGGGFYYHIDYLISNYPDKKILIIEPSYKIFYNSMKKVDLTRYFKNRNILFIISQDSIELSIMLAQILINKGIQEFDFACLPSYRQLYKDFCTQVENDIFNMIKTLRANIGTEYVHSRKWIYNTFKNLRKTNIESLPLESIFKTYTGMPAIIVSAGPSLEKQLEKLRNNKDKFFIIAAGSAVNVLEKNSIIPHMVVAIDAEEVQDNIFSNIKNKNITLAYGHSFRYSSLDIFKGKKYWFRGNADNIVDFYEDYIGEKTDNIEIGPSCAHEAMDIARRLGCNPLIFIGQDLAYTNKELYSKGVVHNLNQSTDIGDRIVMKDMYGDTITTKTAFLVMKNYFENYIRNHSSIDYINCTEGGLEISGMKHEKFNDIIGNLSNINIDLFKDIEMNYIKTKKYMEINKYLELNNNFFEFVNIEIEKINRKSVERLKKIKSLKSNLEEISLEKAQELMDDIIEVTNEIEMNNLHKGVFHSICAAYFLSIRQNTYSKIQNIIDEREKFRILLEGIEKQYLYYEVMIQGLIDALS